MIHKSNYLLSGSTQLQCIITTQLEFILDFQNNQSFLNQQIHKQLKALYKVNNTANFKCFLLINKFRIY